MFPSKGLLSLLFIFLTAVDASAIARRGEKSTLAISRRSDQLGSVDLVERDHARVEAMQRGSGVEKRNKIGGIGVQYTGGCYVVQVEVGRPTTKTYTLVLDTASANTWIGARKDNPYVRTQFSEHPGSDYTVSYFGATWSGTVWLDTLRLSHDLVVFKQSIGVSRVFSSNNANGIDGVLGVGPVVLTKNTVIVNDTIEQRLPTVMNCLYYREQQISEEVLGVLLKPGLQGGELTFGSFDASAINGSMHYFRVTMAPPASEYWGLDLSIKYGNDTILSSAAGIFASMVPFIALPPGVYYNYKAKTGANIDPTTGYLTITYDQYTNLESLVFNIGGVSFILTPNAQIWPRHLNYVLGGSTDKIYLVVSDLGKRAEPGFEVVIGYSFLERFYSVFDATDRKIGLAYTNYTFDEVN